MGIKSKFRHKTNLHTYFFFILYACPASDEAENIITLIFNYTD